MQALTQPKSGSGYPSQAIARSKWRRIFYLLTAFNIVTVSGALYLTYQVLTLYRQEELAPTAGAIEKSGYLVAALAVFTICGVMVYGHKLRKKIDADEKEKEKYFRALIETEGRLTNILDSTYDGVMLLALGGKIEVANERAGELLAFDPRGVSRLGLADLLAGQFSAAVDYHRVLSEFQALLKHPEREQEGEFEIGTPGLRTLHWAGRPAKGPGGEFWGFTLTFRDVTKERQVDRMKTEFVSFATHQLRTPLAGIKWLLELAAEAPDLSEEMGSYIQDARASTERLIALVNDLLDVSRLESGRIQVEPQEIRLGELTREVIEELSLLIREKGHELSTSGGSESPPVLTDPKLLREVLVNLISNAIKYTPQRGKISIRMARQDSSLRWEIQDNGIGIPKEIQQRLFEKFVRAENAQTLETEGTGLGLYLARALIERLGGGIGFESQEGKGSRFYFTLPLEKLAERQDYEKNHRANLAGRG